MTFIKLGDKMATYQDAYHLLKNFNARLNTCLEILNELLRGATPRVDPEDPIYQAFRDYFPTHDFLPLDTMTSAAAHSGLKPAVNYKKMLDDLTAERDNATRNLRALEKKKGTQTELENKARDLLTQISELENNISEKSKRIKLYESQIRSLQLALNTLDNHRKQTGQEVTSELIDTYNSANIVQKLFSKRFKGLRGTLRLYDKQGGSDPESDRQRLYVITNDLSNEKRELESLQKQKGSNDALLKVNTCTLGLIKMGREAIKSDTQIYFDILTNFFRHLARPSCTRHFLEKFSDRSSSGLFTKLEGLLGRQEYVDAINSLKSRITHFVSKIEKPQQQLANKCRKSTYGNKPIDETVYDSIESLEAYVSKIEEYVTALKRNPHILLADDEDGMDTELELGLGLGLDLDLDLSMGMGEGETPLTILFESISSGLDGRDNACDGATHSSPSLESGGGGGGDSYSNWDSGGSGSCGGGGGVDISCSPLIDPTGKPLNRSLRFY